MSKKPNIQELIDQIAAIEIKLPKLSFGALTSLAYEHYDSQGKDGHPTAQEIAKSFAKGNATPKEQANAQRKERDWTARRCVEYLRVKAAELNPELVQLAATTTSRELRDAIVWRTYKAIGDVHPGLAQAASEARIRKSWELAEINQQQPLSPLLKSESETPKEPLPEPKQSSETQADVELVRRQVTQIVNTILICLTEVNDYLVPQAKKAGIPIDAQQAHAWAVSAWITLAQGSKAHWKMPTERSN